MQQSMRIKRGLWNIKSFPSKAVLVNDPISDHHIDVFFFTETCLSLDEFGRIKLIQPPVILIPQFPEALAKKAELQPFSTQACQSTLNLKSAMTHSKASFLVLHTNLENLKSCSICYSELYSWTIPEFLPEFSEFLSTLVISTDKIIIVGNFNIHVDVDSDASALSLSHF